jgi:hypothetical protein
MGKLSRNLARTIKKFGCVGTFQNRLDGMFTENLPLKTAYLNLKGKTYKVAAWFPLDEQASCFGFASLTGVTLLQPGSHPPPKCVLARSLSKNLEHRFGDHAKGHPSKPFIICLLSLLPRRARRGLSSQAPQQRSYIFVEKQNICYFPAPLMPAAGLEVRELARQIQATNKSVRICLLVAWPNRVEFKSARAYHPRTRSTLGNGVQLGPITPGHS